MTTTKDDALAAALNYYSDNNSGEMRLFDSTNEDFHPHFKTIFKAAEQALTHPPLDVEALKRGPANEDEAMCQVTSIYNDGWNHCIDDLASKGYLK